MTFIDMHNHCTWGIDDGIPSLNDCKLLFEMAKKDGIDTIVATPHFIPGRQQWEDVSAMQDRMLEARDLAQVYGVDYYSGSEVFLNEDYLDMIEREWFYTLAGSKYVLCEFNVRQKLGDATQVEDRLYELILRGYVPLIAHAERYFHSGLDMERIHNWIDMGCRIQVNRTSILGSQGKVIQKNAIQLLKSNQVHIVATDAHRVQGSRICRLSDVYEWISKHFDVQTADLLTKINPMHILQNEDLESMQVQHTKRSLWNRQKG